MVKLFLVCLTAIIIADLKYCTPIIEQRMRLVPQKNSKDIKILFRSPFPQRTFPPLDIPYEPEWGFES